MSEVIQPKPIKVNFLMRGFIIYGAMLLVAGLFGSVPVFLSYRKIQSGER